MRPKQKFAAMLAGLLILLQGFPVFAVTAEDLQEPESTAIEISTPSEPPNNQNNPPDASSEQPASIESPPIESEEQSEIPAFSAKVVETSEHPGLYGTLSHIPENAIAIAVEYSFGGEIYYFAESGLWELNEDSPDVSPLTQLCLKLDERPYTAWQNRTVNSLYIRLFITCYGSEDIRTEPIVLSHQMTVPIPETPPPFTAEIVYLAGGYQVSGHFEDFPPDVVRLRPLYSLDGLEYKAIDELYPYDWSLDLLGTEDEEETYYLENQLCIAYYEEPLAAYVAGKLDRFYLLLEITTESGVYRTEAAVMERGATKPIPEGVLVKAVFPFAMRPLDGWGNPLDVPYGQYQITVREGSAAQRVPPLLPDTLPIEVQLWSDNSPEMLASDIVQVPVTWKTLPSTQLMAGQQVILSDALDALVVPDGTEVSTPLGSFVLNEPVIFGDDDKGQVHLVMDTVGRDEAPDVSLQENSYENSMDDIGALSLAFRLKPSGATEIKAYTFVEGDEDWSELCDLLTRRELNHNQAMGIYGFVPLLQPEDSPFSGYLENGAPFLIGLKIVGGTFDGEKMVLPWPGDYMPPARIPEPGGSEGNENNAGSGGGDSTEEGQRPGLPQAPEEVKPPASRKQSLPEEPQADSGNAEQPTDVEGAAVTAQPSASQLPQVREDVPVVSIQKDQTAESTLPDQTQSPWTDEKPNTDEKDILAGQRSDNKSEAESDNSSLPMAATAAIAIVGGGIAVSVGVGAASGTVSGSSFWGKLLKALCKLFSKR